MKSGIFPASIYLLKFNNGNTRTMCEISPKLTITTPGWCQCQLEKCDLEKCKQGVAKKCTAAWTLLLCIFIYFFNYLRLYLLASEIDFMPSWPKFILALLSKTQSQILKKIFRLLLSLKFPTSSQRRSDLNFISCKTNFNSLILWMTLHTDQSSNINEVIKGISSLFIFLWRDSYIQKYEEKST